MRTKSRPRVTFGHDITVMTPLLVSLGLRAPCLVPYIGQQARGCVASHQPLPLLQALRLVETRL